MLAARLRLHGGFHRSRTKTFRWSGNIARRRSPFDAAMVAPYF
jgi:hypothetical protein